MSQKKENRLQLLLQPYKMILTHRMLHLILQLSWTKDKFLKLITAKDSLFMRKKIILLPKMKKMEKFALLTIIRLYILNLMKHLLQLFKELALIHKVSLRRTKMIGDKKS